MSAISREEDAAVRVRPARETDMMTVLEWRNHPAIRRFMLTRHEIDLDEHRQWFQRSLADPGRHLLIAETVQDGQPLGFVHFSARSGRPGQGEIFEWGFYRAPTAPRGSGRWLMSVTLAHAFEDLRAHKIFGQVLDDNAPSRRLHERLGFRLEGELRDQHADDDGRYHALYCYGLLRHEWPGRQPQD